MSPRILSFIVKIWIDEDDDDETSPPVWHGLVTEVPGGARRYVKHLGEIGDFIGSRLAELRINFGPERRLPP